MKLLQSIWQRWKQIGHFIGDVVARLVLTFFYGTIFLPFALFTRLARDPLDIKHNKNAGWLKRDATDSSLAKARKLY